MSFKDTHEKLWKIGMRAIQDLEVDRGMLASGKEELYGCIFGRDSLLTSLLLLDVYEHTKDGYLLSLVRKVLVNLAKLQGRELNRESGEEPGKIIHEFRPDKHEHLTKSLEHPWYLYPDGVMRNYDSVDATPLFLITLERYYRLSNDSEILELLKQNSFDALWWIINNSDDNRNGFIDYQFHPERKYGGLVVQSWMDSGESLFFENDDERPSYPIAPVEVQAYAYRALSAWSVLLGEKERNRAFSERLEDQAYKIKTNFGKHFILENDTHQEMQDGTSPVAYAVDGKNRSLTSTRSSIGHCLLAGWWDAKGRFNSVLPAEQVAVVVERLMQPDMFVPEAGIRTLSSHSKHFEANSYHNGSIWPHDTALIAKGLKKAGYEKEAAEVRAALLQAYEHFDTPIELFVYDDASGISEYRSASGQEACRLQAWSAAALLATLCEEDSKE